jgi:hypothetical protein
LSQRAVAPLDTAVAIEQGDAVPDSIERRLPLARRRPGRFLSLVMAQQGADGGD